jgi:hypothetical protein
MYSVYKAHRVDMNRLVKIMYILLGLLVGATLGLYVAARTLPLSPPIQYYYLQGKQP